MLKVSIIDICKGPGHWKRFQFDGALRLSGLESDVAVVLDLKLTNAGSRIMVEGPLRAGLRLACARCAEMFAYQVQTDLEESFVPQKTERPRPDDESADPELWNVLTYQEDWLVLDELIRQELLAAVPIQPVCQEQCKGLCDGCGQHLNQGSCSCKTEEMDPRWAPLLQLSNKSKTDIKKESAS